MTRSAGEEMQASPATCIDDEPFDSKPYSSEWSHNRRKSSRSKVTGRKHVGDEILRIEVQSKNYARCQSLFGNLMRKM